jgi:hypothetical protein
MVFPWNFRWAPVLHFPFSGAVRQVIAPETDWFFGRLRPGVGDPGIEQRVFEDVASYGKQLGLITEVLLEVASRSRLSDDGKQSLDRLKQIAEQIEKVKVDERSARRERLKDALLALRDSDRDAFEALLKEVQEG